MLKDLTLSVYLKCSPLTYRFLSLWYNNGRITNSKKNKLSVENNQFFVKRSNNVETVVTTIALLTNTPTILLPIRGVHSYA